MSAYDPTETLVREVLLVTDDLDATVSETAHAALTVIRTLAKDVVSMAESGGMPDTYKATDSRMVRAQQVLDIIGRRSS